MEVRPIRTEADHEAALREIERLWGAAEGTLEEDRLDVLVTLVDADEQTHYLVDPPGPLEAIRFRLEQQGLNESALVGVIGDRVRVREVMRGQRALTLAMIRRLYEQFQIPAEVLIQPAHRKNRRKAA